MAMLAAMIGSKPWPESVQPEDRCPPDEPESPIALHQQWRAYVTVRTVGYIRERGLLEPRYPRRPTPDQSAAERIRAEPASA